jgi:hypothetical protein
MEVRMNMLALIAACGSAGVVGWVKPPKPDMTPRVQGDQLNWRVLEAPLLMNHVQITHRDKFVKAGEAYFDHESPPRWVIFQAVPVPEEGMEPETGYAMYVAKLTRDDRGRITGTEEPVRLSPPGSANTCGWFDPKNPSRVIYGSTILPPSNDQKSGFQVGTRRYVWMFPDEMEIVEQYVFAVGGGAGDRNYVRGPAKKGTEPKVLFSRPNYDAESSFTRDGKFVLYAHVRDEPTRGRPDADIYVYDMEAKTHTPLVVADGYDGGPFFSPDDKWICYRSDRRGDDLLQLFIAELDWKDGKLAGIKREIQITDDSAVNWAPYWHPSGKFLVYGSSAVDPTRHSNYEVFAVEIDPDKPSGGLRQRRVTFGNGADVLPVFSDDGKLMMWTAQRGPMVDGEPKPSSQVWIAEVNPSGGLAKPAVLFENLPDQWPEKTGK